MAINRERKIIILTVILMIMQTMLAHWRRRNRLRYLPRAPIRNMKAERKAMFKRMWKDSDTYCYEQLRMRIPTFECLCHRLQQHGLVKGRSVKVKEQVAMFLHTVGHDLRNRISVLEFFRSGETVSRYFHKVLNAILGMYKDVVRPATIDNSPDECNEEKPWHHFFKDAVGAIDGTHFETNVAIEDQARYRDRNGKVSQNVLVACSVMQNSGKGSRVYSPMYSIALLPWYGPAWRLKVHSEALHIEFSQNYTLQHIVNLINECYVPSVPPVFNHTVPRLRKIPMIVVCRQVVVIAQHILARPIQLKGRIQAVDF